MINVCISAGFEEELNKHCTIERKKMNKHISRCRVRTHAYIVFVDFIQHLRTLSLASCTVCDKSKTIDMSNMANLIGLALFTHSLQL